MHSYYYQKSIKFEFDNALGHLFGYLMFANTGASLN